jgi:hypothetical protein
MDKYVDITEYSALWNDGSLRYNNVKKEWIRNPNEKVVLICLNNSQNIIYEFLSKVYEIIYKFNLNALI